MVGNLNLFLAQAITGLIVSNLLGLLRASRPQCPLWSLLQVFLGLSEDRAHSIIPAETHWSTPLDMRPPKVTGWCSQLSCCSLPYLYTPPPPAIGTSTPSDGAWLLAIIHRRGERTLSQREDPESRHLETMSPKDSSYPT